LRRRSVLIHWGTVALLIALVASTACQTKPPPLVHTLIPHTGISLVIPDEFRLTEEFPGLVASDRVSTVMITEVARPTGFMYAAMAPQALADRGLRTLRSENVVVDGRTALFVHAIDQSSSRGTIRRWMLVFGAGDYSVVLTASTTKELSPSVRPVLEQILLGALWDPRVITEISSELGFSISETGTLKVSDRLPQMIVLTRGGHREVLDPEEPLLLVGSTDATGTPIDLAVFARTQLFEMPELRDARIVSEGPVGLGGLGGYEIVATAVDRDSGAAIDVYQAVASDASRYYLVQGLVGAAGADEFMPQFREVAASFERTSVADGR
jgi:hypothetical protein